MRLSRWLLFVTIMMIVLCVSFYYKWKSHEAAIIQQHININQSIIEATIQQYEMVAKTIFNEAINKPEVLQILSQIGGASYQKKSQLRGQLYQQISPVYQRLKQLQFRQLHFHTAKSISFLRFHRLEHFGDLLSAARKSVVLANKKRQPVHGFESGKHFQAFRNVFPISHQGKNLGTVEVSLSFNVILDKIKQLMADHDYLFVMKKDYVFSSLYFTEDDIYQPLSINPDYVYEALDPQGQEYKEYITPSIQLIHSAIQSRKAEIQQRMAEENAFVLTQYIADTAYLIEFMPVKNIFGENRGYIIFYAHSDEIQELFHEFLLFIGIVLLFTLSIAYFIWKQYQFEKILVSAKQQAEQANLAKNEFLTNISHEIRTPLNGVLGIASILSKTSLDEKQRNLIELLQNSGENLLKVISDILDISKFQKNDFSLNIEVFDLNNLLGNIESIFSEQFKQKKINFLIQRPTQMPSHHFNGDMERITQVLFNLLDNALKFTEQGYVILLVQPGSNSDENQVWMHFEVSDTGIGINPAYQEQLFQAFSQADGSITRKYGGTGLGLIISKKLASLMKGELSFESTPGLGSKFCFEIPLEIATLKLSSQSKNSKYSSENLTPYASANILLVEDNIVNQEVAMGTLTYLGCHTTTCPDGKAAIREFETNNYDLVLMDISMPVMDGLEATRHIREHEQRLNRPQTPIIALTAHVTEEYRVKSLKAGMNDILTKPFSIDNMDKILTRWLVYKGPLVEEKTQENNQLTSNNSSSKQPEESYRHVLDLEALEQLRILEKANQTKVVERVINHYLIELPRLINEMQLALNQEDCKSMWQAAHSLKSASINVGALQFSELCLQIENRGKQGQCDKVLLDQLKQQSSSVTIALQKQLI